MFRAHPVKNYSIVGQSKRTFFCMMKWSTGTIKGLFSSVNTIAAHEKHTRHGTIIEEPFKLRPRLGGLLERLHERLQVKPSQTFVL